MSIFQLLFISAMFATMALTTVGGLGGLLFYALLVRRLKFDHGDLWQSLGSPSYVPAPRGGGNDYYSGALFEWIWRREYLTVSDPDVARLARTSRTLFISLFVGLACIALTVAVGLVLILHSGHR